jgi:hypothetical protein
LKDRNALAIVKPPKGARILGILARWEYKEDNGTLLKYKVRIFVRGDQQVEGGSSTSSDLYPPAGRTEGAGGLMSISLFTACL